MATNDENTKNSTPEKKSVEIPPSDQRDWLLMQIVDWANTLGVETALTINVGGLTISGVVVGGIKYFEQLTDVYSLQFDAAGKEAIKDIMNDYAQTYREMNSEVEKGPRTTPIFPTYLHLREARIFSNSGDPMPANQGILWRGRISAIDGFWIGMLESRNPPS